MSFRKAALWTSFWAILAIIFGVGVYYYSGQEKAMEFMAAYLIELSLSIDNLFLFLMLFSLYKVDCDHQRRVLNWGIMGAVVMRLIFIVLGIAIVQKFHWILYVFGVLLIVTGYKMAFGRSHTPNLEENWAVKILKKFMPVTCNFEGDRFFTRIGGVLHATPLFVVLLLIESTDLLFAMDSIPAVFAITADPFIIYSSNVLAILGLRSLYFFLERVQRAFIYVKYGVALLLGVTGLKMLLTIWHITVPVPLALSIIALILVGSIVASMLFSKKEQVFITCSNDGENIDSMPK